MSWSNFKVCHDVMIQKISIANLWPHFLKPAGMGDDCGRLQRWRMGAGDVFHDLMWVQFRRYCCLIVFFAFYKCRVFFWCIHEQVRGAETSKLDREILADIAGKTNKLGLRLDRIIWDDVQKTQLRMFKTFPDFRDFVSNLAQPARAWANPLEIPPLESWGKEARWWWQESNCPEKTN